MAPELVGDPLAGHPKYERVRDLNSGAFGAVVLARNLATGRQVAVKLLPRGDKIGRVSVWRGGVCVFCAVGRLGAVFFVVVVPREDKLQQSEGAGGIRAHEFLANGRFRP